MELVALYELLASPRCTTADGDCRLPAWETIALVAHVDPVNDTYAVRALIEKGAMTCRTIANTYGDQEYRMVRPSADRMPAFYETLRTIGAVWRG